MLKFLFFDYREYEAVRGFARRLEQPVKHPDNPLLIADQPWENGNMQLYGSVVKAAGRPFQLWYSTVRKPWWIRLAYAESEDGVRWRKPSLDLFRHRGRKANIVLDANVHGPTVIVDEQDPDPARRYKLIAGTHPSDCISVYLSADGIHWHKLRGEPQIPQEPDCPMAFLRKTDGRYVAFHRVRPIGRRICRSESWDLKHWSSEPRMILEPGPGDPPQLQFYGMGLTQYGPYELGTLWTFYTDESEMGRGHMRGYQEAELAYSRSGYAWHRVAQGTPFISHGSEGDWDCGNLQCASAPVYLDDEIRYYYAGTDMRHKTHWELDPQTAGLGMAGLKPDRFVALEAGRTPAELLTVGFALPSTELFVNAAVGRRGSLQVEMLDVDAKPVEGLGLSDCLPIEGDSTSHAVRWSRSDSFAALVGKPVRLRLRAVRARVYSIFALDSGETSTYHRFRSL